MKFGFAILYSFGSALLFSCFVAQPLLAASLSSIGVNVVPENPAPGENVAINLSSFANDLDSVNISWFVNGKSSISDVGKKSFSLNVPISGGNTSVLARIAFPEGSLDVRINIRPNSMVLLWEALDSYVPPFYKGKSLPTADTEIKVVAMPEIRGVSPDNMIYSWKRNYTQDQGASGYGKNYFIFTSDYLEDRSNISVIARTAAGLSSESGVSIDTALPFINFYRRDAGLGVLWERALGDNLTIVGEETLVAAPYFISPENLGHPALRWNWSINNRSINVTGRRNLLPLKAEGGISGSSSIRLDISNQTKIFQSASREINVGF